MSRISSRITHINKRIHIHRHRHQHNNYHTNDTHYNYTKSSRNIGVILWAAGGSFMCLVKGSDEWVALNSLLLSRCRCDVQNGNSMNDCDDGNDADTGIQQEGVPMEGKVKPLVMTEKNRSNETVSSSWWYKLNVLRLFKSVDSLVQLKIHCQGN